MYVCGSSPTYMHLFIKTIMSRSSEGPISLDYSKDVIPGNLPEKEVKIGVDSEDGEDWKEFILGPKYKKRVFPPKKREREEKDK